MKANSHAPTVGRRVLVLLALVGFLAGSSCILSGGPQEVLQQGLSPSGRAKFTLARHTGSHATVPDSQLVYISAPDEDYRAGTLVFDCHRGEGITVRWLSDEQQPSDEQLEIAFETAYIDDFSNLWRRDLDGTSHYVEVFLKWKRESALRKLPR